MIIQATNIVAGFILAAPKLKALVGGGAKEQLEAAQTKLSGFQGTIGIVELILGVIALVERLSIAHFYIPSYGSSFPQAFAAIAIGLILSANLFEKYPSVHDFIGKLKVHSEWIGIVGIAVGAGSFLFGCIVPGLCGGYGRYMY